MARYVHLNYSTQHPGVARFESAFSAAQQLGRGFSTTRALSTLLLSAMAAAVMVVAYQVMDTVAEGHLMLVWMALWLTAFTVLAAFASSARTLACSITRGLDRWSRNVAETRADERLWAMARADARIMTDLQSAFARQGSDNGATDAASFAKVQRVLKMAGVAHHAFGRNHI